MTEHIAWLVTDPDIRMGGGQWVTVCREEAEEALDAGCSITPMRPSTDAEKWAWFRQNFNTHPGLSGLHACETPERLEAHVESLMKGSV